MASAWRKKIVSFRNWGYREVTNNWTLEEVKPYIYHVIECFGLERVIFAGDWPVVTQASEYSRWVAALFSALDNLSKAELHKLFYSNAVEFYKL